MSIAHRTSSGCSSARVKATGRGKNDAGILRIDYPGFSGEDTLAKMDWDAWFEAFDANRLAFVYQPSTRFSKLVSRRSVDGKARGTARRSATAGRRTGAKKSSARRGTKRSARSGRTTPAAKKRTASRSAKRTTKRAAKRSAKRSGSRSGSRQRA